MEQKGNMKTRTFRLKRFRGLPEAGGQTLFFRAMGGDRRHPMPFFRADEVPAFDGESALFLAEYVPRRGWRILGRVHSDGESLVEPAQATTEPGRPASHI
jgi:hypothetical protein